MERRATTRSRAPSLREARCAHAARDGRGGGTARSDPAACSRDPTAARRCDQVDATSGPRLQASMPRFARRAVCSPLTLASTIGLDVLRDGGNAVDAAVATNLALAVAYPHMCGVGGDLLAMVWADGVLVGLNSSGRLPAAAAPAVIAVPERGIGSATVPGAPAGWQALVARFGTRPLRSLADPAIRLARDGVTPAPGLARMTEWSRGLLQADPEAARIFLAGGPL